MSPRKIEGIHTLDVNGNPGGGVTDGVGIHIEWQDGPLGRGGDRSEPNGAFVEGVIAAATGWTSTRPHPTAGSNAARTRSRSPSSRKLSTGAITVRQPASSARSKGRTNHESR
jgi:hypothetical protein